MATAPVRHAPAPYTSPLSGSIDQRLAQLVDYINSVRSIAVSPTVSRLTMVDELGQSWSVTIDSAGAFHTSLIPR